jgi:hypothetical protein
MYQRGQNSSNLIHLKRNGVDAGQLTDSQEVYIPAKHRKYFSFFAAFFQQISSKTCNFLELFRGMFKNLFKCLRLSVQKSMTFLKKVILFLLLQWISSVQEYWILAAGFVIYFLPKTLGGTTPIN